MIMIHRIFGNAGGDLHQAELVGVDALGVLSPRRGRLASLLAQAEVAAHDLLHDLGGAAVNAYALLRMPVGDFGEQALMSAWISAGVSTSAG